MHTHIFIQTSACFVLTTFIKVPFIKPQWHQCKLQMTTAVGIWRRHRQREGQVGAASDNIKQGCLTWGERPVVRHSIRRGQKGLPISKGHNTASICHSEAPSSPILFHIQTETHWNPLKGEVPRRANIAGGQRLLMRRVTLFTCYSQSMIDSQGPKRGWEKPALSFWYKAKEEKGFFN